MQMRRRRRALPEGLVRVAKDVACGIDTGHAIRHGLKPDSPDQVTVAPPAVGEPATSEGAQDMPDGAQGASESTPAS